MIPKYETRIFAVAAVVLCAALAMIHVYGDDPALKDNIGDCHLTYQGASAPC